jgi:hypothetical protein
MNQSNWLLRTHSNWLIYAFLLVNLSIAVPLAFYLNLRSDEGYTMESSSQDISYAVDQAIHFELQAPFYFGVISVWRNMDDSVFFTRLFSIICILLAAMVIQRVVHRYLPDINPIWIQGVFLLNPVTIYAEVDARGYALVTLLSSLLLLQFYDGYIDEKRDARARIFYAILALIALYTHYYTGFLLAACGLSLLLNRNWISFRNICLDMILPAVGLAFLIPHMGGQYGQKVLQAQRPGPLGMFFFFAETMDRFLIGSEKFEIENMKLRYGVRGLISLLLAVPIILQWRKIPQLFKQHERHILFITVGLFGSFTLIYMIWGAEFTKFKFMIPMLIPLIMSLYVLLSADKRMEIWGGYTLLLFLCAGIALVNYYDPLIKSEDYIGIGTYIEERENEGQPVVVFENVHHMLMEHHYHGVNELYALPFPINFAEPWGHERWVLESEEQVHEVFTQQMGSPDQVWLVTHEQKVVKFVDLHHEYLEDYIAKNYVVESEDLFERNMRVRFLRKKRELSLQE